MESCSKCSSQIGYNDSKGKKQKKKTRKKQKTKKKQKKKTFKRRNAPKVEITLRLFFTLMVTNCIGERSFSGLKRIKNEAKSTLAQRRFSDFSILNSVSDKLRKLNLFMSLLRTSQPNNNNNNNNNNKL